jgi:hypothetical protein
MIDTVHATLYINWQHINNIQKLLESMQSSHDNFNTGIRTYGGGLRNLRIKINESRIKVEGSLATFHHGNNVESLTHETAKLAIEELSDCLSLPMKDAQLNRLDIAQNLALKYQAASYYPYFGERPRMQRLEQGKGLYYRNTLGDRVFYDKTPDLPKIKSIVIDANELKLTRFEVRHPGHKNICKQLNLPEVTLGKLCEPQVYRGLISNWGTEYDKIEKYQNIPLFDDDIYRNPAKFCAQVTYRGIQSMGGQNAIMSLIKQAKQRKIFSTHQQYTSLSRKVRSLGTIKNSEIDNPMLDEINTKVLEVLKFAV